MNERIFRFDTIVAVCALLISCVAAVASVYQTRVFRDQYAATIWPYLNIDDTTNEREARVTLFQVDVTNNGLGPALIRSAQLYVAHQPVQSWNDLRDRMTAQAGIRNRHVPAQTASIDSSTTIRPGDSRTMFKITLKPGLPAAALATDDVTLDVCYCSLNNNCWHVRSNVDRTNGNVPQPIAHCTIGPRIDTNV